MIEKNKEDPNEMAGWMRAFEDSKERSLEKQRDWRKEIGEPFRVLEDEDLKLGFWRVGGEGGNRVFTARIGPKGALMHTVQVYEESFINVLWDVLKNG
jgi:hypothetical protein